MFNPKFINSDMFTVFSNYDSFAEDHEYLHGYLDQLCDDGVRNSVVDWAIGGGVYADYLDVCSVVEDMKKSADPTPAKLEQLRPRLLALCSRLNNLKCHTATHRLVDFITFVMDFKWTIALGIHLHK